MPRGLAFKGLTIEQLLSNTVKTESGCMEWKGNKNGRGYGVIYIGNNRSEFTHRAAMLLSGVEIPKGHYACHKCDNPICCNPEHLFVGTPKDNADDARGKGRLPTKKPRVDRRRIATHGKRSMYNNGCRCRLCRDAARDNVRRFRERRQLVT